ncbi:MAG: serine/threonine-protein kinase [Verrucomicrobiota bacterium]|nr:serine/threonine-protein kinase [Verrucomicrobiota bacterium]
MSLVLRVGSRLGDYQITEDLGDEGVAREFYAEHLTLKRPVSMVVLSKRNDSEAEMLEQIALTARSTASLTHQNIVSIYDFSQVADMYVLIREYADGYPLEYYFSNKTEFSIADAIVYIRQAASALAAAHHSGIAHFYVNPENLILTNAGLIKINNLGLSLSPAGGSRLRATESDFHSLCYAAPELILNQKDVGHGADIYSLGAIFYQMLCHEPACQGKTLAEVVMLHQAVLRIDETKFPITVDPELKRIVLKMLARKPVDRYKDMGEADQDLYLFQQGHKNHTASASVSVFGQDFPNKTGYVSLIFFHEISHVLRGFVGTNTKPVIASALEDVKESPSRFPWRRLGEFLDRIESSITNPRQRETFRKEAIVICQRM